VAVRLSPIRTATAAELARWLGDVRRARAVRLPDVSPAEHAQLDAWLDDFIRAVLDEQARRVTLTTTAPRHTGT
jgi:hypothetical protein